MSQNIPAELKYTKDHEWAQISGNICTIGITDFAQSQLGDIVFVELPEVGRTLSSGEGFGVVESIKSVSDLYSPISGEVVERNENLVSTPDLINQSPYESWMIKVKMSDASQVNSLLSASDYSSLI